MLDRTDELIVAVSSAPGHGALGIVRLSGPGALTIAAQLWAADDARPLSESRGSSRDRGHVVPEPGIRFPADVYVFRSPHSYTRQDLVEFHTVGSPAALQWIRRRTVALGARPAQPGEFTARAFLNGAMDLAQAEGVAAVIRALTDTQLRASRRMMDGDSHNRLTRVREELADLLALVEADIDFAEEPIEFITPAILRERLGRVADQLQTMLAGAVSQERLDALPRILFLGRPNAGKSSLMNALAGASRAICAPAAGTTRDLLSAPIGLGRGEAVLLDAAGIDSSDDPIIAQARILTLAAAEQADLVCLVADLSDLDDQPAQLVRSLDAPRVVVAANKCDLLAPDALAKGLQRVRGWRLGEVIATSAVRGLGLEELRSAFAAVLGRDVGTAGGDAMLLTERQQTALREAKEAIARGVEETRSAAETIDCADRLAFELREALDAVGAVTGEVTTEDLLGRVFANFCVGK